MAKMSNPLLCVIISIHKVEPYLAQCAEPVRFQTYTNLETILVNDELPDNCSTLYDQFIKGNSSICVIHKSNGDICNVRNAEPDIASSLYIDFTDSDDWRFTQPTERNGVYACVPSLNPKRLWI